MKINLPDNHTKHNIGERIVAYTIPADGFEKLIGYSTDKGDWTHKNYRTEPKKSKKKRKKS